MTHATVFRDESTYASHASACQAANGDILVAFRQAPFEHIFAHVHPQASVGLARSRDGGKTWDHSAITVFDPGDEININDPSLTTLRDGTIILTVFTLPCPRASGAAEWGDRAKPVRGNDYFYVPGEQRILLLRSFDHGSTWDGPYEVDVSSYGDEGAGVFASVVETADGTLLLPITARSRASGVSAAALVQSRDGGETWEAYSAITTWHDGEPGFGLPSTVAYDDEMLSAGWSVAESGTLITRSGDGGLTWTAPEVVDTRGACMHLCVTSRGTTLMSYGHRNPPYGIRVMPSIDRGVTWDHARGLRSDGAMRDLGYPWTIQLADGRLLCVYYFNTFDADKGYYDEAASLALCEQWKLDPELYTYKTAGMRFIAATIFSEDELQNAPSVAPSESADGPTLI